MEQKKKKILIIEDDRALLKVLKDNLEIESDCSVIVDRAYDGEEGLRKALKFRPDLILLDIIMPGMDGVEFMRELRNNPSTANVKVVILTNISTDSTLEELKKLNIYDYILKSNWDIEQVINRILNLV